MILLLLFISIYLVSGLDHVEIKTPPVVIGDKRGPNTLLDFMNGDEMCGFALLYTSNVQTDTTNMLMI